MSAPERILFEADGRVHEARVVEPRPRPVPAGNAMLRTVDGVEYQIFIRLGGGFNACPVPPIKETTMSQTGRFQILDFDRHDERGSETILCVVDQHQTGSDGEHLIVGEYETAELAEAVRDALIETAGDDLPPKRTGINVNITNELARATGMLAARHLDRSIQIEWRETSDEREWFVTASDGVNDTVYVVDDESGSNMPLSADDLARYDAGLTVLGDDRRKA